MTADATKETPDAAETPKVERDRKAAEALGAMLGASIKQLAGANESQQTAILALTAILAASSATASADPEKLAVMIEMLTKGHPNRDTLRKQIANYVSLVIGVSSKLPGALARAKAKNEETGDAGAADGASVN